MAVKIQISQLGEVLEAFGFGKMGSALLGANRTVLALRDGSSDRVPLCEIVDAGPDEIDAAITRWFKARE
jgi:hypothetical protein